MVKAIAKLAELNAELEAAANQKKAVLIDFHASWCGPCRKIAPTLEALAQKYPNMIVLKVDVDEADEVALKYSIEAMPTFVVVQDKNTVETLKGASEAKLTELFVKYGGEFQLDPNESSEKVNCCGKC